MNQNQASLNMLFILNGKNALEYDGPHFLTKYF